MGKWARISNNIGVKMISTWGIFWIAAFSAGVLKVLIRNIFYNKRKAAEDVARKELKDEIFNNIDSLKGAILTDIETNKDVYQYNSTTAVLDEIVETVKKRLED